MDAEVVVRRDDPDEDEVERFRVAICARTRHADIWPLVQAAGSIAKLSRTVGIDPGKLGTWLNLKAIPSRWSYDAKPEIREKIDKLLFLAGKTFDEMWPPALCKAVGEGVASAERTVIVETGNLMLAMRTSERLVLPPAIDSLAVEDEREVVADNIQTLLKCLTPRQRQVIEMRFFADEGRTLHDVAKVCGVAKERIRLIEVDALRRLRDHAHITDKYPVLVSFMRSKGVNVFLPGEAKDVRDD